MTNPPTAPTTPNDDTTSPAQGRASGILWVHPSPEATFMGCTKATCLGRGGDADVNLDGGQVSRRHAELVLGAKTWQILDLESRNGTFVNGERVTAASLESGSVVRIGEWVGVFLELPAHGLSSPPMREILPGLLGGPRLAHALRDVSAAASSDLPVIIEGETGTGKERVANAIHLLSKRTGPFLAVNCAALPESLAESELFGHRRGAFTGADRQSPGLFRAASGGTLLLDEIADLPLPVQAKLLRVLEERCVLPLGESRPVPINVRIIAAGQVPLHDSVASGAFRPDLFARLDGFTVRLPPLRDHAEDVPTLLRHYLRPSHGASVTFDPRLIERLCVYDWPFNIRELIQIARRSSALHSAEGKLDLSHLPERFLSGARRASPTVPPEPVAEEADPLAQETDKNREDFDRLVAALRANGGNVSRAARVAGVSRQRAYRLMSVRGGVDVGQIRAESTQSDGTDETDCE